MSKLRQFADEHDVVIRVERLKSQVQKRQEELREKRNFLFPLHTARPLPELLKEARESWEERRHEKP